MKLPLLLLFTLLSIDLFSQGSSPDTNIKEQLRQLDISILSAFLKADVAKLDNLLTTDYREIYEQGRTMNREEILKQMKPNPKLSFRDTNMEVRVYGDAAIITTVWEFKETRAGAKPYYTHFTDVFVKQAGNWKLSQSEELQMPAWRVRPLRDSDFVAATTLDCAEEPTLKSVNSDIPTYIRFKNNSKDTIIAYWIDYSGKRDTRADFIKPILPGQSSDHHTYVTHPFVVVGTNNHCLGIYMPTATPTLVNIQ